MSQPQMTLQPRDGMEVWQMQIPGTIILNVLKPNRLGQQVAERLVIGPNQVGFQFHLAPSDRDENQRAVRDPNGDPFRNGMLVRVDKDQQQDPNTASKDALSDEELMDICDMRQAEFEAAVSNLGEVSVRRTLAIATQLDVSHKKVSFLEEHIRERFAVGGPQPSLSEAR